MVGRGLGFEYFIYYLFFSVAIIPMILIHARCYTLPYSCRGHSQKWKRKLKQSRPIRSSNHLAIYYIQQRQHHKRQIIDFTGSAYTAHIMKYSLLQKSFVHAKQSCATTHWSNIPTRFLLPFFSNNNTNYGYQTFLHQRRFHTFSLPLMSWIIITNSLIHSSQLSQSTTLCFQQLLQIIVGSFLKPRNCALLSTTTGTLIISALQLYYNHQSLGKFLLS